MPGSTNSQVRAKVWLRPDQVDDLRTAALQVVVEYLQERDHALITLMYDTVLRVGELIALDADHLRDDNTRLYPHYHSSDRFAHR